MNAGASAASGRPIAPRASKWLAVIEEVVTGYGSPAPTCLWDPPGRDLPGRILPRLLRQWQELRGAAEMPRATAIDPVAFSYALGHLLLLETLAGGADFRYRVYGTVLVERYGKDLTGTRVSDHPGRFRDLFLAGYRAVHEAHIPLFVEFVPPPAVSIGSLSRLILPFADEHGAVTRLLVGSIPGEWRSPQP